jgi:hypothetical protein
MDITNKSQTIRSEVLRSPSLYFKEFEATEKINNKKHQLLSGTRIKAVLVPLMYWVIKHAPKWCAMLPIHLLIVTLRLMYIFSNNPYRKSCEDICQLARDAGFTHQPKQIYGQILNNLLGTAENYYHLYRHGIDSVIDKQIEQRIWWRNTYGSTQLCQCFFSPENESRLSITDCVPQFIHH